MELGVSDEGRQLINWRYHHIASSLPGLSDKARNSYDELSAWLRQVTERAGIHRQSEYFLTSWLLSINFLLLLRQELAMSNHPQKEQGLYWIGQLVTRMETAGLWHLQFSEDADVTAGIMGDTGQGEQEGEV